MRRVSNADTSLRPDVPAMWLRLGGVAFRWAFRCVPSSLLWSSLWSRDNPTWWQRFILWILASYPLWDCWDELSEEDKKGMRWL